MMSRSPFFWTLRPPPGSTLFPYTTLFRSRGGFPPPRAFSRARGCSSPSRRRRLPRGPRDRKSTRLNSSHVKISYAVFCLKKKKFGRNLVLAFSRRVLRQPQPVHPHTHSLL